MILIEKIEKHFDVILKAIDDRVLEVEKYLLENKEPIDTFEKNWEKAPGVYAIFVEPNHKKKLSSFPKLWDDFNMEKYSKTVSSRFQKSIHEQKEIYTFYLGKSEKVVTRLNEHFNHTATSTTYGLKLAERDDIKKDYEFYYAYYELEKDDSRAKAINQFIITRLESKLRERMNPWVGKQ